MNSPELGKTIRRFRISKGYTQREFSDLTGIPISTLKNYELGRYAPKDEMIDKICAAFQISKSALLSQNAQEEKGFMKANMLTNQLIGLFAGGELTDADKEAVIMTLQRAYIACKNKDSAE